MKKEENVSPVAPSGKITVADIFNESAKLFSSNRVPSDCGDKEINPLNAILERINPVDFRASAELDEKERIKDKHRVVITVETVQQLADEIDLGLCKDNGNIYAYNHMYWERLEKDQFSIFLAQCAEKMGVRKVDTKYHKMKDELYEQFLSTGYLKSNHSTSNRVLINLKNGTFEITPSEQFLRKFRSEDFLKYQLPFEFDPKAQCPMFFKYLNRVLPDMESQRLLAEFIGSIFINRDILKLEKALILLGGGANGKSVFFEIINSLLGETNVSNFHLDSLTDDKGQTRAQFADKLLNYSSELSEKIHADRLKQLISQEPIDARRLYKDPVTITNYPKLVINANKMPHATEKTEGFYRRFLIILFNVHIPEKEQDKELSTKIIKNELSGVFNWVLEGLQRLMENKRYSSCAASDKALERYKLDSDSVGLFLDENGYQAHLHNYESARPLHDEYRAFCLRDGYKAVSKAEFLRRLESKGIAVKRQSNDTRIFIHKADNNNLPF